MATMTGLFATRRQAEMAVERLVQEFHIAADRVSITAANAENTVGKISAGSDKTDGTVKVEKRKDSPVNGSVAVTVEAGSDIVAEQVGEAFKEFRASLAVSDVSSETDEARQSRIRDRAYYLWEAAGCLEGREEAFWHRAAEIENARPQMKEPELRDPSPDFP